jgi:addiction module HigA family antidote
MRMHNPPHPGEVLKTLCLEPLKVSVTDAAKALGVSRKTLSAILNGRAGISPEMAIRLSMAFETSAESWLNQQLQYDLWHAEQRRKKLRVRKLAARRSRQHPASHYGAS